MQSFRGIRSTTNPYLSQLVASLPGDIRVLPFSWGRAILGRYEVLHTHWPENLLRGRPGMRVLARRALFVLLTIRLRVSRTALVRTLHNEAAHEGGSRSEQWMLGRFDRATTLWIRLNQSTRLPFDADSRTILHGDYRNWFQLDATSPALSGRLLTFGLIRPYKGVENLLESFAALDDAHLSLRIVGKPSGKELERSVRALAEDDPRIGVVLEYVDDAALAREIGAAELVVLPYRAMHNSGALLLALSLERPVLVPANEVTAALRDEVGHDWMELFDGDLTADTLARASDWVTSRHETSPPDLTGREWATIGVQHRDAYRAAVKRRRNRGKSRHE